MFLLYFMFLLYVDDSGSVADASHQHFVLAGVAVFERQGHWLAEKLDAIAARFNPGDPTSVELHGSPMLTGKHGWRSVPLATRIQAMKDALDVLAQSHVSTKAFGVAVKKSTITPADPVDYAFEKLTIQFDEFLKRLYMNGDKQRGLFIFDKSAREIAIQRLATNFKQIGHNSGKTRNMAEVPVFVDSRASRLVQLADLIAYAIFRHFERQDSQFFDVFKHRFDQVGGIVHGLYYSE